MQHEALRTGSNYRINWWSGSADALIAAGVAELHEFPGQPARNTCVVTIRPIAGLQGARQWAAAPGYRRIARSGAGFRVEIVVPADERTRRENASAARIREREEEELQASTAWESRFFCPVAEATSGVIVESWYGGETTFGSREQLIAARGLDASHFPEGRKRWRTDPSIAGVWRMQKVGRDRYRFGETLSVDTRTARSAARASVKRYTAAAPGKSMPSRKSPLRLVWSAPTGAALGRTEGPQS